MRVSKVKGQYDLKRPPKWLIREFIQPKREEKRGDPKVARWQILIPSFSLDCARVEGVGDQILQRSVAEP